MTASVNRLEASLAYAADLTRDIQSRSSARLFTTETAHEANALKSIMLEKSEQTKTVRLRLSTVELAERAWTDKKLRIERMNAAIKQAAEAEISKATQ